MKARALAAALAALCLAAVPAQAAASTHAFQGVVASGTPAVFGVTGNPFDNACGVAVSATGNRYVANYHGDEGARGFVAIFNPSNEYVSRIPSPEAENSPCDLALDSTGRLYVNDLHGSVFMFPGASKVDPQLGGPPDGVATGIAVGSDNRLYVAHRDHVSVYGVGGTLPVTTIGDPSTLTDAYGIAVSSAGFVYVGDAADDTVKVFDPATDLVNPIQTIDGSGTPAGGFTDLTDTDLAIDPTDGDLLVVDNLQPGYEHPLAAVEEFGPSGAYIGQISHWVEHQPQPSGPDKLVPRTLVHAGPSALTVDSAGNIYITSGNEEGSVLYGFKPAQLATAPVAVATAGSGGGRVISQLSQISQSAFTGIDCGLLCSTEYELGTVVTFTPIAQPHSAFSGWSGACTGTGPCTLTLAAAAQLTATFSSLPQRTLTVTKGGAGVGTVTSFPVGLDCGATCTQSFDQGSKVTLSAEAAPGSEFTGWSGACSGSGECRLTLGADAAVGAGFRPIEHPSAVARDLGPRTLAIAVGGSGFGTVTSDPAGIQCGTPCSGSYPPGTAVTLTASPDPESHFAGWSGCDSVAGNRCSVTLAASRTVSADFAEGPLVVLGALKLKAATGTLKVTVAAPGVLSAAAKLLSPATVKARKSGTVTLPLTLSKAGKKALARAANGRLEVKVAVTFKPSGGGAPLALHRTVTFKSRSKR
jgi:Divergent InlB B-repeat domain